MKIITTGLIIFFFLCAGYSLADVETSLWQIKKSEHFVVYFQDAPPGHIEELIASAEGYYHNITGELGFTRFEGFWTWDKRAKIYLFKNKEEYLNTKIHPEWSEADVNVTDRRIHTYVRMDNFFDIILPHELAHIIFREFIGYKKRLPLWLDEGIACFMEKTDRQEAFRLLLARQSLKSTGFVGLEELSEISKDNMNISPDVFYAEAASVIQFLFGVYGQDKFVEFCRNLRSQDWKPALFNTYKFKNLSEMNKKWKEFLSVSPAVQ